MKNPEIPGSLLYWLVKNHVEFTIFCVVYLCQKHQGIKKGAERLW